MPLFYFLFKLVDTSFFCGESILLIFNNESSTSGARIIAQDTYVIVLIAFAIMLIFIAINAFSTRAAKTISSIASIAKFLPLIVVGILGIVFGALDGFQHTFFHTSLSSGLTDDPTIIGNINVLGIFASLPALLFTFDSFLTIGNAASSMRNPEKDVPKAILIGIPVIVFLYLFVTIGQLLTGQKDVYSFFSYVVTQSGGSQNALVATNIIIGCVIMISLLGSVNAFTLTAIRSMQSAINDEILIGSVALKRITNGRALKGGALMAVVLGTIASGLMAIPIIIQNKDAAYDGVSNLPTLFFFIIYAIIILFGLINHFTNKIAVKKIKLFPVIACIAIIGCAFAFGYNLFYEYFGRCFADNKDVS
jgi:amino acid transporter